jgi:hypothetical protein
MQWNSGWQDGLRERILAWINGCERKDEKGPFMAELVARFRYERLCSSTQPTSAFYLGVLHLAKPES